MSLSKEETDGILDLVYKHWRKRKWKETINDVGSLWMRRSTPQFQGYAKFDGK